MYGTYVNDGTDWTRGVGAVAALDRSGSAASSSTAGSAVQIGSRTPTTTVRLMSAPRTVKPIYGVTVPYPTVKTAPPPSRATLSTAPHKTVVQIGTGIGQSKTVRLSASTGEASGVGYRSTREGKRRKRRRPAKVTATAPSPTPTVKDEFPEQWARCEQQLGPDAHHDLIEDCVAAALAAPQKKSSSTKTWLIVGGAALAAIILLRK